MADKDYIKFINLTTNFNKIEDSDKELGNTLDSKILIGGNSRDVFYEPNDTFKGPSEAEVIQQVKTSIYNRDKLNYMEPSKTTLFTIQKGTILYHGSLYKELFNTFDIRLGEDKLVAYFSPNRRLAADYIRGCADYPIRPGYIHKFRVKKNIEKIMIISTTERKPNWTLSYIEDTFCSRKFRIQLDGIGFLFPRRDEHSLYNPGVVQDDERVSFDFQTAICDPNEYLEYVSTQRCLAMRKLSSEYNFNR